MSSMRVHLTFPGELVKEPLIYNLGKMFNIVTNIRRANVEEKTGWVVLEMTGIKEELQKGIKYLESQGVQVKPISGDVIES
jgi:ABC-type methionine transport system ATPase subunit